MKNWIVISTLIGVFVFTIFLCEGMVIGHTLGSTITIQETAIKK